VINHSLIKKSSETIIEILFWDYLSLNKKK